MLKVRSNEFDQIKTFDSRQAEPAILRRWSWVKRIVETRFIFLRDIENPIRSGINTLKGATDYRFFRRSMYSLVVRPCNAFAHTFGRASPECPNHSIRDPYPQKANYCLHFTINVPSWKKIKYFSLQIIICSWNFSLAQY